MSNRAVDVKHWQREYGCRHVHCPLRFAVVAAILASPPGQAWRSELLDLSAA
jgi:hypothetical protein